MKNAFLVTSVLALLCLGCLVQAATEVDLTVAPFDYTINRAIFSLGTFRSTGTGVFDPFVRIQANRTEQGYNSDLAAFQFDEKAGIWTHALQLSTVPLFMADGVPYREFRLDVNQSGNDPVSLDALKIYQSNDPLLSPYDPGTGRLGGLDPIYDMGTAFWVKVPSGTGSGSGDMGLFVLDSLFDPAKEFVELYSFFGANIASNDGFEEWGVLAGQSNVIPEPSSLVALLSGVLALGGFVTRKRR